MGSFVFTKLGEVRALLEKGVWILPGLPAESPVGGLEVYIGVMVGPGGVDPWLHTVPPKLGLPLGGYRANSPSHAGRRWGEGRIYHYLHQVRNTFTWDFSLNSKPGEFEANGTCIFMRELGQRRTQYRTEAKVHALADWSQEGQRHHSILHLGGGFRSRRPYMYKNYIYPLRRS